MSKNTEFCQGCQQKEARNPSRQRGGRGDSSLGPLSALQRQTAGGSEPGTPILQRLVERHQIAARCLGGGVSGPVPSMPFNPPFMSLTFSPVCPLHCPCMSRSFVASHFPTSHVVPIGFLVRCFPCPSETLPAIACFDFCPLHVPFSSLLFACHVPLLSCHVNFLFPPPISLHFLAFPLCSPIFLAKKHGVSSVFVIRTLKKHSVFPDFRQREAGTPNQQRAGRGNRAWDPCDTGSPKTTFSGTSSNCRAVLGGGGKMVIRLVLR